MRKWLLAVMSVGVVTAACTGDDDDDDGGTPADVSGTVSGSPGGGDNVPVVGATVTEVGTSNSATTASGGVFTISVEAEETVFLRATATDYYPTQRGVIASAAGVTGMNINMPGSALVAGVGGALGATLDPAKGILAVSFDGAFTSTAGGFTVTLSAAADGSFTFSSNGTPTLTSATLPNGQDILIFYNVDVGNTTVVANPPGAISCTSETGITNELVTAGTITDMDFDCQ